MLGTYRINYTIVCKLKTSAFQQWQTNAYQQLLDAYNNAYTLWQNTQNDAQHAAEEFEEQMDYGNNPGLNRIIEQRELKRICIEMMANPFNISSRMLIPQLQSLCEAIRIRKGILWRQALSRSATTSTSSWPRCCVHPGSLEYNSLVPNERCPGWIFGRLGWSEPIPADPSA